MYEIFWLNEWERISWAHHLWLFSLVFSSTCKLLLVAYMSSECRSQPRPFSFDLVPLLSLLTVYAPVTFAQTARWNRGATGPHQTGCVNVDLHSPRGGNIHSFWWPCIPRSSLKAVVLWNALPTGWSHWLQFISSQTEKMSLYKAKTGSSPQGPDNFVMQ